MSSLLYKNTCIIEATIAHAMKIVLKRSPTVAGTVGGQDKTMSI